jgi:hypothetical protein
VTTVYPLSLRSPALRAGRRCRPAHSPQNGPLKVHIVAKMNGFVVELEKYEHWPSKNACSRSSFLL